jgi:hypothetical protein
MGEGWKDPWASGRFSECQ